METIKNYLESMFRNLPNTEEVLKAKAELLQMMEDKYTELIREGKSENEAVAKVIAEFGNLDEVSASLGIKEVIGEKKTRERRNISLEEVKEYISDKLASITLKAAAIIFFIMSPVPTILFDDILPAKEWLGPTLLFVFVAIGVALIIVGRSRTEQWRFIKTEPCSISPSTTDYVVQEKRAFQSNYTALFCTGLVLCVCCFIPPIVFGNSKNYVADWGAILLFAFVAAGVFLIIYSNKRYKLYKKLLELNSQETIGGTYTNSSDKEPVYTNETMRVIMSIYWPTVTCVYLCLSFLTFRWGITWIIWPIAGVVRKLLDSLYLDK